MKTLLKRLREPSSYAGIAAVIAAAQTISHGNIEVGLGMLGTGLVALFAPEKECPPFPTDKTGIIDSMMG